MVIWNPLKLTAMHHRHVSLGATMADYGGWQRPARYTSPEREVESARVAGGLCDVSPMGKYVVQGGDVDALLGRLLPEAGAVGINRAAVASLAGPDASATGRAVVSRFSEDELFITCLPDQVSTLAQALKEYMAEDVHMVDMTSNFAAINVAGPKSAQLLAKLTDLDISASAFPDMSCVQGQLAEVYAIVVRGDQGGLPGYYVYFGRDFGEYIWEAMLHAGHEYGIGPMGVEALERLGLG